VALIDDLTTPLTKDEVEDAIYSAIESRGVATAGWKPGAVVRTFIAGTSIVLAAFSELTALIARSGFLSTATGDWLELLALEVYGVTKNKGSFATGNVTLTNSGGGVFAVAIGDLTVSNSLTGKAYKNTAAFNLAAGSLISTVAIQVPVSAIEIGSDSTSIAAAIDTINTSMIGVTVTNALAIVGQDPESDPALRARASASIASLSSNGPKGAYESATFGAVTTGGTPAGVTRIATIPDGLGNIQVLVATASGVLSGVSGDASTPLGAVELAIAQQAEPIAINASVAAPSILSVGIIYEAFVKPGSKTPAQIESDINTALASYIGAVTIGGNRLTSGGGGFVFRGALLDVITETIGDDLVTANLIFPVVDQIVLPTEAPVAGAITSTVTETT